MVVVCLNKWGEMQVLDEFNVANGVIYTIQKWVGVLATLMAHGYPKSQ